jgi:photosystem II stability/assembly factor-like uncharacterized protein
MPKPGADLVVTQKHRRAFSQRGGPSAVNTTRYEGADETYMVFDDDTNPITGGRSPINFHDPLRRAGGAYRRIGETVDAPDFPGTTISFMQRHGGVSWNDFDGGCFHNFYEVVGRCKRPDDFINGWDDYVKIYSYGRANGRDESGLTSQDSDDASMTTMEFLFASIYKVGALLFGEKGAGEVEREVVGVVWAGGIDCGACGPGDNGTNRLYAVTKSSGAASPGTPAEVIYTVDGGATFSQQNITGLGGTVDPTGIALAGSTLIVLDTAGNGYWIADINTLTGTPGTWTNVTSGFVASKQPTDIYVAGASEVYFSANGGYIYRSTDLASGVTAIESGNVNTSNYGRIHGQDDTIVVVGDSGKIVKTNNRGATWANVTLSPTSATVRAILVLDDYRYWVGTSGGFVYYTINGGETFVLQTLPGGTLTVIDDIVAATDEVIHIAARTSTPTGRLITSWNGGQKWASSAVATQRIQNLPTASRFNRIAVPRTGQPTTDSNTIALGGLSGGGTDGILELGVANRV